MVYQIDGGIPDSSSIWLLLPSNPPPPLLVHALSGPPLTPSSPCSHLDLSPVICPYPPLSGPLSGLPSLPPPIWLGREYPSVCFPCLFQSHLMWVKATSCAPLHVEIIFFTSRGKNCREVPSIRYSTSHQKWFNSLYLDDHSLHLKL